MHISKTLWIALLIFINSIKFVIGSQTKYRRNNGNEYLIETNEEFNWYQASMICSLNSAQLVTLDNKEKAQLLEQIFEQDNLNFNNLWIGGKTAYRNPKDISNATEEFNTFHWYHTRKQFSFAQWDINRLPNKTLDEQCVFIASKSKPIYGWRNGSCTDLKNGFVCEKSLSFDERTKNETLGQSNLNFLDDLKTISNNTVIWRELIRKTIRKAQINIVRTFFSIEQMIAKLRGIKDNDQ